MLFLLDAMRNASSDPAFNTVLEPLTVKTLERSVS